MFHDFAHRHTPCTIDEEFRYDEGIVYGDHFSYNGVTEKVILTRDGRGSKVNQKQYAYNGLFAPSSIVKPGALVKTNDSFFVMTMRLATEKDKHCSLLMTNARVIIQRHTQQFDDKDNPIGGPQFETVQNHVIGYAEHVSSNLRKADPGLLPSTIYTLYLHMSANIERPSDVTSPDRIVMNQRVYQVDVVDDVLLPNILYIQLSEDMR